MTPSLSQTEILSHAIAKESIPAIPRAGSTTERAQQILKKAEDGHWREGLELATREPSKPGLDTQLEQIGATSLDKNGKVKRTSEDQTRYNQAKEAGESVEKLLNFGYDSPELSPAEKTKLQTWVIDSLKKANPNLARIIDKMKDPQKIKLAERYLHDSSFLAAAGKHFNATMEKPLLTDSVTEADVLHTNSEAKRAGKQGEVEAVSQELTRVENSLKTFERDPAGVAVGSNATKIDQLEKDLPQLKADQRVAKTTKANAETRVTALTREREIAAKAANQTRVDQIDTDIATEQKRISDAELIIENAQEKTQELDKLKQQEQTLREQRGIKAAEKARLTSELKVIEAECRERNIKLNQTKIQRKGEEEGLVTNLETIVGRAANDCLNQEYQLLGEVLVQDIETKKQETKDAREKTMYEAIQKRWTEIRKGKVGILKEKVAGDFEQLMKGGPEAVMKNILTGTINPETKVVYTPAEIDKLLKDQEFVAKIQPEVIKQLIANKMITGGIRQEEVFVIINSQWGKGMIEQAIDTRKQFRQMVEGIAGAEALRDRRGFWQKFIEQMKLKPELWWMLFAGIIGAPIAFAIAAATSKDEVRTY